MLHPDSPELEAFRGIERARILERQADMRNEMLAMAVMQLLYAAVGSQITVSSIVGGKEVAAELTVVAVEPGEFELQENGHGTGHFESILWLDSADGMRTPVGFKSLTITLPDIAQ